MTGAEVLGVLLYAQAPLTAFIPTNRIKGGRLPDGAALPSLLVRVVSLLDRQPLVHPGWFRSDALVSVMVRAESYDDQNKAIRLVRAVPKKAVGTVGTARNVVVLTAGLGPDVIGPGNTFEQTQTFRVAFDAFDADD
ncbi:MAG: hypothetical protein PGN16_08390 [Sphingomonas phyllosphaerae]|uniref:hypothetical protein n=1 Tax=Sphingomonas phyllosphaerae TaxID=257003 RepID=UPI002FFB08CD